MIEHRQCLGLILISVGLTAALSGCAGKIAGREIRWNSGEVELVGTLALPDEDGRHPLLVFVPGSGCVKHPRANKMMKDHTKWLNERGFGFFVYDKRGCGESKGDWRDVGLEQLADDLLAVMPQLQDDPKVDSRQIGLIGLSQGAWVSLICATKSDQVRFVVLLSGPPMTPAEQGHAIVELGMRKKGWDDASIRRAVELDRLITEVYRSDTGWDEAKSAIAAAADRPWFRDAGLGIQPRDAWNWKWLRTFMDYDPIPALRKLPIPILAIFGEDDMIVPAKRSQEIIDGLSSSAQGPRETVLIHGVGHTLRRDKNADWPGEYWDALDAWLKRECRQQ